MGINMKDNIILDKSFNFATKMSIVVKKLEKVSIG
jgi:hypothetical protein